MNIIYTIILIIITIIIWIIAYKKEDEPLIFVAAGFMGMAIFLLLNMVGLI